MDSSAGPSAAKAAAPDALAALIVDDFAPLGLALAQRLSMDGYDTTLAEGVSRAKACLAARQFDLVLVDWDLPDGSGVEVARAARAGGDGAFVVLMSGMPVSRRDRRFGGCVDAAICKPWRSGELQDILDQARRHRQINLPKIDLAG